MYSPCSLAGQVAEWLKAHAWKVCNGESRSRVRIPLCPPKKCSHVFQTVQRTLLIQSLSNTSRTALFGKIQPNPNGLMGSGMGRWEQVLNG